MDTYNTSAPNKIPFYKLFMILPVETAIWPILYHSDKLCESFIGGTGNKVSLKRSFVAKCNSTIVDYSQSFELLQFQYERWLYKTVSGKNNIVF